MSAGINQAIETISNLGNTFVDSYQKGLSMKMALEENRRKKMKEAFAYLKEANDEYSENIKKHGKETSDARFAERMNNNLGKTHGLDKANITPSAQGVLKQVSRDEATEIYIRNNDLIESDEKGRAFVTSLFENKGINKNDSVFVNFMGSKAGNINWEATQDQVKSSLDIKKKIKDLEKTATNVTAKGYPKNINTLVKIAFDNGNLLQTPDDILEFKKLVNGIYKGYYEDVENVGSNQLTFDADGNRI